MRILRLINGELKPVYAERYQDNKNKKVYYNVKHGCPNGWEFRFSVDSRMFKEKKDNYVEFTGKSYIIREIKKQGKPVTDKKGNPYYVISRDFDSGHKEDMLVLWELGDYDEAKWSAKGFCKALGEGVHKHEDCDVPAPVVEIYGDCTLSILGKKDSETKVEIIKFTPCTRTNTMRINRSVKCY